MSICKRIFNDNDIYQMAIINADLIALNDNYRGVCFVDSNLEDKGEIQISENFVVDGIINGEKFFLLYSYEEAAVIIVECENNSHKTVDLGYLSTEYIVPYYRWINPDHLLLYDYSGYKYLIDCTKGIVKRSQIDQTNDEIARIPLSQIVGYNHFSCQILIQREGEIIVANTQKEKEIVVAKKNDIVSCDVYKNYCLIIYEKQAVVFTKGAVRTAYAKPGFSFLRGGILPTSNLKYVLLSSDNANAKHCELEIWSTGDWDT